MNAPQAPLLTPDSPAADHKDYAQPWGSIAFQKGAMELGRNGWTTEEVLDVLIDHLRGFQRGKFACRENAIVLTKLEEARLWIRERARVRAEQGIKGRDAIHSDTKLAGAETATQGGPAQAGPC